MNHGLDSNILLHEPNALMRQAVAMTTATFEVGIVNQAASLASAKQLLKEDSYDIMILSLDDDPRNWNDLLRLIREVRAGDTKSPSTAAILVSANNCMPNVIQQLKPLRVNRILLKPFKAKLLLESLMEAQKYLLGKNVIQLTPQTKSVVSMARNI